ncbi:hypothetical protein [Lentzea sp. NPDC051838]|uniref:hypothetical protein n=1 Tax=Lentzea sp. NPDC051838 TaxID=3154849 RepID=UPI00343C1C32
MTEDRGKNDAHRAAIIAAVGAVVAAVLAAVSAIVVAYINKPATSASTPVSSPTSPSVSATPASTFAIPAECDGKFGITRPADMTKISASGGAEFAGTACDGEQIWLLDHDPTDGYYYQVNAEPLVIAAGAWRFVNAPIGNPGDRRGTVYPVVVLRATTSCSEALKNMKADGEGTVKFTPLPTTCPAPGDKAHRTEVRLVNDGP